MASHTSKVVPVFDFSQAITLPLMDRYRICLERARQMVVENRYQSHSDFPCVPDVGATNEELRSFETKFGITLPDEYRQFLSICRYLKIDDGREIGGLDHDGVYYTEIPWVSDAHRPGVNYLVFANYWCYADGDQLMFDLTEPQVPVVVYLHEHGPLYEYFAPSFSLALWRLVHEEV